MKNLLLCLFIALPSWMNAQIPVLGDTLRGGIVFFVNETQDTAFICGKHDAAQYSDWAEAKMRCEVFFSIWGGRLYYGWRMPTLAEMAIMRKNRDVLNKAMAEKGGRAFDSEIGSYYWTGTEGKYGSQAWMQAFGFDNAVLMNKGSNSFFARAVQSVPLK